MKHRRLVATLATAAVLVVPAGAAQASNKTSSVSADAKVKVHVAKAHKAIARLKVAVYLGNGKGAISQLKIARQQTAAASRTARAMANKAGSATDSAAAAAALIKTATEYEDLLETVTDLVDEITGDAQESIVAAILPTIAGHDGVLDSLVDLLDEVPDTVQETLATVLTALSLDDATEILNLEAAVKGGHMPANVTWKANKGLEAATESLESAIDTLEEIVELLPKPIRGPIKRILDIVDDRTEQLTPELLETVTELVDSILDALPILGDESISADHLLGDDLLGDTLGDLLGDILGDDNGDGGLLGISELIDDLLDGVLGDDHHRKGGLLGGVLVVDGHGHRDGGLLGGVLGGGHGEDGLLGGLLGDDGVIETVTELIDGLLEGIL